MNIFFIDENPDKAARMLSDKHVVKMILESCQLLATAHRISDEMNSENTNILPKATHINHPCSIWTRESVSNYKWLYLHFCSLLDEYTKRYTKKHAYEKHKKFLFDAPKKITKKDFTLPACAMSEEYKIHSSPQTLREVIINYRNYYILGKSNINVWRHCDVPNFVKLKNTEY